MNAHSISNQNLNINAHNDSFTRVYFVTSLIPKGKVLTYKKLSEISMVNSPRVVGTILHKNPDPQNIPCHRVVSSQGKVATTFAFGGGWSQKELLENEGVVFIRNKIDLKKYLWRPSVVEITKIKKRLINTKINIISKEKYDQNCLIRV